jgi:hypothetical protein
MIEIVALILANPFNIILLIIAFGGLGSSLYTLIENWLERRHHYYIEELKTRRIEALSLMGKEERKLLLDTMPDWLDKEDPEEVKSWVEARKETLRIR